MSDAPVEVAAPQPEPEPEPFPFWSAGDLLLLLGLGIPAFIAGFALVAMPMHLLPIESKAIRLLVPQFAGYACALMPMWGIFRSRYGRSPLQALKLGVAVKQGFASVSAGIAGALLVFTLGALLRAPKIETPMEDLLKDPVSIAIVGLLAVTFGPLVEEVFFRGLLQPLVVRRAGAVLGIVACALPFGLIHGPQYAWSWRHILLVTLAGSLFGWRRHTTGSTGAAAIMHAFYNLTVFLGFLLGRWLDSDFPQSL